MTRTIDVLSAHEVNVQRKYRAVWIAVGEYMGERIEAKEGTEANVAAWQRAAEACEQGDR